MSNDNEDVIAVRVRLIGIFFANHIQENGVGDLFSVRPKASSIERKRARGWEKVSKNHFLMHFFTIYKHSST